MTDRNSPEKAREDEDAFRSGGKERSSRQEARSFSCNVTGVPSTRLHLWNSLLAAPLSPSDGANPLINDSKCIVSSTAEPISHAVQDAAIPREAETKSTKLRRDVNACR